MGYHVNDLPWMHTPVVRRSDLQNGSSIPQKGPRGMRDLVDTTEMYLRTIYELEEEGIIPLRARIAERLEQSGPTVSQTVARMERDGWDTPEYESRFILEYQRPNGWIMATVVEDPGGERVGLIMPPIRITGKSLQSIATFCGAVCPRI